MCRLPGLIDLGLQWPMPPHVQAVGSQPVRPPRVLLCGEADFSYAAALVSRVGGIAEVTATAFEEEEDLLARYPYASGTIQQLRNADVRLDFGIDARALRQHFPQGTWDRVVFNLPQSPPQHGARNQIQRHRALLQDFCVSAADVLSPSGQVWVTLLAGQGGTHLDTIQRIPGNSWHVQHAAARGGLLVVAVLEVEIDELTAAGYMPGGRGIRRSNKIGPRRKEKGLISHILVREGSELDGPGHAAACACKVADSAVTALAEISVENTAATIEKGDKSPAGYTISASQTARSIAPLEWVFDNSFWVDTEHPLSGEDIESLCRTSLKDEAHVVKKTPELIDAWTSPEGRSSRTYRFFYSSSAIALSRDRALEINRRICENVAASGNSLPRTPSYESLTSSSLPASDDESKSGSRASGMSMLLAIDSATNHVTPLMSS
eukprot:scaffold114734_cov33-Tisochrysis_lutea.AAC.2